MRESRTDLALIRDENGLVAGFALGFDFCAEHQFGIGRLKHILGIEAHTRLGVPGRSMTITPEHREKVMAEARRRKSKTRPHGERVMVVNYAPKIDEEKLRAGKPSYGLPTDWFRDEPDQRFTAAWDEGGFAIRAFGADEVAALDDLIAAFRAGDISVTLGRSMPFGGSGLSILITSRLSEATVAKVMADDIAALELRVMDLDIGIRERIHAAGLGYHALSPKPAGFFKSVVGRDDPGPIAEQTKYPLVYFLNPRDQANNNHGWYTVEELDAWTRGEGPVPKKNGLAGTI